MHDKKLFFGSVSSRKFIEVHNCVVHGVFNCFSKRERYFLKKAFVMHLKMLQIVHLQCSSSLPVVCGSGIWLEIS